MVWSSGKGVCVVLCSWFVDQLIMIVCQSWDVLGHSSIDSLGVVVIFEGFVVHEHFYFMWGPHEEVSPVF